MRRLVIFIMAVGMAVAFSGVVLAGGFGECSSYGSHNQAATDKADEASKTVATKAPEKADADKVVIAQTAKPAQPPAEAKK
jgi:NAD/NADP transhydrogenase beta subunit